MNNKLEEMKKFYDDFSADYDGFYGELTAKHYLEKEKKYIKKYIKGKKVIELGAGSGLNLLNIKSETLSAIGADISFNMCLIMRNKGLLSVQASADALPFKKIDCLLMFLFIHHFNYIDKNNFTKLLRDTYGVLDDESRIIIKESNRLNLISRFVHFIIKETNMADITPFYLINSLKKNGYEIDKIKFYGFMAPKVRGVLFKLFQLMEIIIENIPVVKYLLCSHYIIIAKKRLTRSSVSGM